VISEEDLCGFMKVTDLKIEEKRIPAVLSHLQRIEQIAQVVNEVELGPEDELAPEWKP
jgi:Asp-tRNA(Asn)/Glu-tRNA(Gln) amidotransferase C subunit